MKFITSYSCLIMAVTITGIYSPLTMLDSSAEQYSVKIQRRLINRKFQKAMNVHCKPK